MAKNRKNQVAEVRLAPVLKVVLLCALIGGSAIGYVWQKSQIDRLGHQIADRETKLKNLKWDNKTLFDQIAVLKSPPMIDRRVKELNLGLAPVQPLQVVRLAEPRSEAQVMAEAEVPPQYAQRPAPGGTRPP